MFELFKDNWEIIFSGLGTAIVATIIAYILNSRKKSISSGNTAKFDEHANIRDSTIHVGNVTHTSSENRRRVFGECIDKMNKITIKKFEISNEFFMSLNAAVDEYTLLHLSMKLYFSEKNNEKFRDYMSDIELLSSKYDGMDHGEEKAIIGEQLIHKRMDIGKFYMRLIDDEVGKLNELGTE